MIRAPREITHPQLIPRRCNISVSVQRRSRCQRRAYPLSDFFFFLDKWNDIQGFIGLSTAYFIHLVSLLQCDLGVAGAIGEIGVAAGKSFAVLAFTRRMDESLLVCDLFKPGLEQDNCPEVNLPMFVNLLEYLQIPREDVTILEQSSLELRDLDLAALGGLRQDGNEAGKTRVANSTTYMPRALCGGFRLFHVDGGHYAEATFSDVNIAACTLVPGGVLLVDDLHNLNWPGVQEGFHSYMLSNPAPRRLEPFLYTGRLFLTTPGYAETYRQALRRSLPGVASKRLYGFELLTTGQALVHVPHHLRQDRTFMLKAVEDNWRALFFAEKELQSDRDLARIAVRQSSQALQLLSPELRTDYEFILLAVRQNWKALADVPNWAQVDRTVLGIAVKQNWQALSLVSGSVCGDRELVYEALTQSWQALQYASDELREDRELVRRAVQQDGRALQYASKALQADRDIVLEAIQRDGQSLQFASEVLRSDHHFIIEAVKRDWRALEHVPEVIRKDRSLAFNVIRQDPMALTCLSEDLRADTNLILEAARQSWTPRDTSSMAEEDCVGCERLLRMHNPSVSQTAAAAVVLTPLAEEQLMKPSAHREGTLRSRFNILERPGKIPEDMRIKSPTKEARCKASRARLVGGGLGTRLRDGTLFVPHSPVLTEPLDITSGSWTVGPGPLPARFRVVGRGPVLLRAGIEKDSPAVQTLRTPMEFVVFKSQLGSDGTLCLYIEDPYEGWLSWKPSIMRRVGISERSRLHDQFHEPGDGSLLPFSAVMDKLCLTLWVGSLSEWLDMSRMLTENPCWQQFKADLGNDQWPETATSLIW